MDDTDSSAAILLGAVLGGRYRLTALLGAGGMGSVYLATDEQLSDRQVAIKVPHEEFLLVRGFRERFAREIGQLIALEHPHIVTILDSGEFDGLPFAVLQYLGGGSLSDRMDARDRTMTVAEVLAWLPTVAKALDFIHRKGFLHRDIKPGNVFFDAEGHAFVADFGIALVLGGEEFTRATQAGAILGSPAYMAPEYGSGEVGPPYDQYALAVLVYHCVSGQLPHPPQATPIAYLAKKMVDPPIPLGPLAPGTSSMVVDAVMRALSTRPEERFATCSEFAAAIGRGAADGTAESPVPAPTQQEHPDAGLAQTIVEEPLAATVVMEEEDPSTVASAPATAPRPPTNPLPPESPPAPLQHRPSLRLREEPPPEPRHLPPELQHVAARPPWESQARRLYRPSWKNRSEQDVEPPAPVPDTVPLRIWHLLKWILALATGLWVLSEGSFALFSLVNPLASTHSPSELAALEDRVALLVAIAAAINLLLSLVAGYTAGLISDRYWVSSCSALAVAAVSLTGLENGLLTPLVNSWALGFVTINGVWLSMVPVPLGLFAGGYASSRQDRARLLGAILAALTVGLIFVFGFFQTSVV